MTTAKATDTLLQIYDISLGDIEISEDNVRESRPETDLDELAASIKLHGLLQPVVLKGVFGKPKYELIGGQRRYLAHERLRKSKIRAVFAGSNLTKTDVIITTSATEVHSEDRLWYFLTLNYWWARKRSLLF